MAVIEAVLSPATPWGVGPVVDPEAYVDDGLGNPDVSYAGRRMFLVYDQTTDIFDFEPGILIGTKSAIIDPDGIARFTSLSVEDEVPGFWGSTGDEVYMRAIVEPTGTWTTYWSDSFTDDNDKRVETRLNGDPSPAAIVGHVPDSPNPFEWTHANNPFSPNDAVIDNNKAMISSIVNNEVWQGYARNHASEFTVQSVRISITFSVDLTFDPDNEVYKYVSFYPNEPIDSGIGGGQVTWWLDNSGLGFIRGLTMYSPYADWYVFHHMPEIESNVQYQMTTWEIDGWQLVYINGTFQMGQLIEIDDRLGLDCGCFVDSYCDPSDDFASIHFDNFRMDTYSDVSPPTSQAYARFLA